jgi:hypothetical protein
LEGKENKIKLVKNQEGSDVKAQIEEGQKDIIMRVARVLVPETQ